MSPATTRSRTGQPSIEWTALQFLCRSVYEGEWYPAALRDLIAQPTFVWGGLLELALRNKLQALVSSTLLHPMYKECVPDRVRSHFHAITGLTRHRIQILSEASGAVLPHLSSAHIAVAARKGILFEHLLYGARGIRVFCDVDLMVPPSDMPRLVGVLFELGFSVGEWDLYAGQVVPHDRVTLITYRLNPDHAPRMVRPTADPFVPCIEMDLACSFTWARSDYQVPLEDAFASVRPVAIRGMGEAVPVFSPDYIVIDGIMHLFREAFVQSSRERANAIAMSAFLDVLLLWRWYRDSHPGRTLDSVLGRFGLAEPAAWVLGHADRLVGTSATREAGLDRLATEQWLGTFRAAGGALTPWSGDMRARLQAGTPMGIGEGELAL